jgi:hypothetical protein
VRISARRCCQEWTGEDQRPDFLSRGSAERMLPNPLWDEGAPEEVVEHLLLAARGVTSAGERSWFTGRRAEVGQVVSWVTAGGPGVHQMDGLQASRLRLLPADQQES